MPNILEVATFKHDVRSGGNLAPNALPILRKGPFSTFEHHSGVAAHEVHITTLHTTRTTMRLLDPREEPSILFPR